MILIDFIADAFVPISILYTEIVKKVKRRADD